MAWVQRCDKVGCDDSGSEDDETALAVRAIDMIVLMESDCKSDRPTGLSLCFCEKLKIDAKEGWEL